jgi:hypothetical protein
MSRTPSAFKQTDITRALNAVRAAGYSAARVLIGKDGRIEIATTMDGEAQTAPSEQNFKAGAGRARQGQT